jgi:hypothetical protein
VAALAVLAVVLIAAIGSGYAGTWPPSIVPTRFHVASSSHPYVAANTSFAVVGKPSGSSASFNVSRADTLLVFVAEHSSALVASVSDGRGNAFKQLGPSGYYSDSNGPERVTVFDAFNLTHSGRDNVTVSTSVYAWTVVFVLDVRGVGSHPLDRQANFTNSSQSGQSLSTVTGTVGAHVGDLVLLVGGIRGLAKENATGGDTLVASNQSIDPYNGERAGLFEAIAGSNGSLALKATNSNGYAPWVADALSLAPGVAWCGHQCAEAQVTIGAHTSFAFDAATGNSSSFATRTGNVILVFLNIRSTTLPVSVEDSYGDSFSEVSYGTIGGCCRNGLALYDATYARTTGAANALTVTMAATASVEVNALVLQGVNTSQPFSGRSSYTSNNYSTAVSSTVTNASDLTVLDVAEWGQYTLAAQNDSLLDERSILVPWQNETGADFTFNSTAPRQSITLGATLAASDSWIALSLALHPGSARTPASTAPAAPPTVSAHTSFAIVGASQGASAPFATHPGDAVVVFVGERGSATVAAVVDRLGNNYSQLGRSGYYADSLGPERVTVFASFDLAHSGTDSLSVTTSSYAWTVVIVAVVAGAAVAPLDAQANVTNSSQPGQSPATVHSTVTANASDLVLMVGGIRGNAYENASGRGHLVDTNLSLATYTSERTAVFSTNQTTGPSSVTMTASSSSSRSPWVADSIVLRPPSLVHPIQHVVVIFMENQARYQVLQGGAYERYLAATYGDATAFWSVCHGSTAAYLAATSGKVFQCLSPTYNIYRTKEIGDLFDNASLSWGDYQESMSTACSTGLGGEYVYYHNPFVFYSDVVNATARCASHVVNSRVFNNSFANGTLLNYSFYTPNLIDDCHNSTLGTCDAWLKGFLAPKLNATNASVKALVAHTAFFILYDESASNDSGGYNGTSGGHVYMVSVSPWSKGIQFGTNATMYNLLSTVEWLFHLGSCGNSDGTAGFPAMTGLFSFG